MHIVPLTVRMHLWCLFSTGLRSQPSTGLSASQGTPELVNVIPDCSLILLTKTASEATWWREGGWNMMLGSSGVTGILAQNPIPM